MIDGDASSRAQGQKPQCSLMETQNGMYLYSSLQLHGAQKDHPGPKSILCLSSLIFTDRWVSLWVSPTPNSWKGICAHLFKQVAEVTAYGGAILWRVFNPGPSCSKQTG